MSSKFHKPERDPDLNPVDYWNRFATWADTFNDKIHFKSEREACGDKLNPNKTTFVLHDEFMEVTDDNSYGFVVGKKYSKFMAFSKIKFENNYRTAISFIEFYKLNHPIPYLRIGTDYFKMIIKEDRFGVKRKTLKPWKKDEIKLDHGQPLLKLIHQFDDFTIVPDNKNYRQLVGTSYNMYAEFSHRPVSGEITEDDIPVSYGLLQHLFGDQIELGLRYMKVLYEMPWQALPILCLVSTERQTGKTTFLNWLSIIFGDNYTMITPQDLESSFNSMYANKNIIAIDETVIDKSHSTEKLKAIATSKIISVNQKHVSNFMLPFFGKIVICTNKETDFAKIDDAEIRFWIRKIKSISKINTKIEDQLRDEIPKFLKYLEQLPEVDTTKSRMVFTPEEISNESLDKVKKESRSWLHKELLILISDFFSKNDHVDSISLAPIDIKRFWFDKNANVTAGYIGKVLRDEMGLEPSKTVLRYTPPFIIDPTDNSKTGKPYTFDRNTYGIIGIKSEEIEIFEDPF